MALQPVAQVRRSTASPRRRPTATAGWNGAPLTKVRNCLAVRTAATSSAGPHSQPIFQPVQENVLPAEEMVRVRSAMPGSVGQRVVGAVEDEVLVHLVGDDDEVVLDGELGDGGQLRLG